MHSLVAMLFIVTLLEDLTTFIFLIRFELKTKELGDSLCAAQSFQPILSLQQRPDMTFTFTFCTA